MLGHVGFKPFSPQREAGDCEFLPIVCWCLCVPITCHQEWGLWQDCFSSSPIHFFSLSPNVYKSLCWFLDFFQRKECSVCSCRFSGSIGGGKFRSFLCHHKVKLLLLSFGSCLFILDTSHLLNMWFEKIFSKSVIGFFNLFMIFHKAGV